MTLGRRLVRAAGATLTVFVCTASNAGIVAPIERAHDRLQQRDVNAPTPAGTALIAGVVTVEGDRSPFRRVLVTLTGASANARIQMVTDDAGRFVFADLRAGRYTLTAEKAGYVTTFYGSRLVGRGPGMPVALAEGQRITNLAISMLRGAVIAGIVRDENGTPISSAQVQVLQPLLVNGERRLVDPPGQTQRATTDDRGRYRIYGLPPGDYTVKATGGIGFAGDAVRLTLAADIDAATRELRGTGAGSAGAGAPAAPVLSPSITRSGAYFPGMLDAARAEFFSLAAGEERTGVDVRNPLVRAAAIDGTMVGPNGIPLMSVSVGLANASAGTMFSSPGLARPDTAGHFVLQGLPPARYLFFGRATEGAAGPPLFTETEVTVNEQDVTGVVVQFLPGANVEGRVAFEGTMARPDLTAFRVALTPLPAIAGAALNVMPVVVRPDGAFAFTGIAPGRYGVAVSGNGAWTLRSAMLNGRDVLDLPLDVAAGRNVAGVVVTLTDQPTQISGTLFDQLGRPTPDYTVVVFSTDRALWTSGVTRTSRAVKLGSDGTYRLSGLPPGEYYLAALTAMDAAQLTDPSFLEQLVSASMKITIAEGEKKTQDLRIGGRSSGHLS